MTNLCRGTIRVLSECGLLWLLSVSGGTLRAQIMNVQDDYAYAVAPFQWYQSPLFTVMNQYGDLGLVWSWNDSDYFAAYEGPSSLSQALLNIYLGGFSATQENLYVSLTPLGDFVVSAGLYSPTTNLGTVPVDHNRQALGTGQIDGIAGCWQVPCPFTPGSGINYVGYVATPVPAVPEPSSFLLLATFLGMIALLWAPSARSRLARVVRTAAGRPEQPGGCGRGAGERSL